MTKQEVMKGCARHSSECLTSGNMEFPCRAITSHYVMPFLAHIPYVATHTTTSNNRVSHAYQNVKQWEKKTPIILCTNLTVIHSSNLLHPLSMSCKDKYTSSSSLLTLKIENDLHNPCIAQGREKQLSCHRVDVGHSLTIDHITTSC